MLTNPDGDDTFVGETHDHEAGSFEVFPPSPAIITSSKNTPPTYTPSKRRRSGTMTPPRIGKKSIHPTQPNPVTSVATPFRVSMAVLVLLVLLMALAGAFLAKSFSPDHIEELRLEFKRDLESLRSEVEQDLASHLLATTKLQTAAVAKQEATQREIGIGIGIENENENKNERKTEIEPKGRPYQTARILSAFFTTETETPSLGYLWKEKVGNGYRIRERRLQSILEVLPSLGSIQDTLVRQLQLVYTISLDAWDFAQILVVPYAQSIYFAVAASSRYAQTAILHRLQSKYDAMLISSDWILHPKLVHVLESANQHRLEFFAWYVVWMLFLYKCCRFFSDRNTKDYCNGTTSNHNNGTSNPRKDDEDKNESCENTNGNNPTERIEDVVMEHLFHDSMAAAGWPVVAAPRAYNGSNRTSTNRQRSASSSSTSSASANTNNNAVRISKEERRRQARINALEFANRDKHRLNAGGGKARMAATAATAAAAARTSNTSNLRSEAQPRADVTSPWASRKVRLQQARANAKIFAEHDKQRLQRAAADSPWNRRNRNL